jgi:hypothetical protein
MLTELNRYDSVEVWGNELHTAFCNGASDRVVDLLRDYDCTTVEGLKALSSAGIAALQKNSDLSPQEAIDILQYSQCLKKFRYGCTVQPAEMQAAWINRNSKTACQIDDSWVIAEMRKLLEPIGPAFEQAVCDGRFGNGAVFEHVKPFARWNMIDNFSYNVRCPDDIRWWTSSSSTTARLCCVPKDIAKLRTITVEPCEASFLQQYTRNRLLIAVQVLPTSSAIPAQIWGGGPEIQRERCLRGSLTGDLATIDLSDASDSISWRLVQRIFPTNIVAALERCRTPFVETQTGEIIPVHMYAGMGNATTFIVESLTFWALYTALSRWLRVYTPVSVFGDDIVLSCRVANHPLVKDYVARHGFDVNEVKCGLSAGPGFREACGLFAYQGKRLPLLRIKGYDWRKAEDAVGLCSLLSDAMVGSSLYSPFFVKVCRRFASNIRLVKSLPVLPASLAERGLYLVDPDMEIGVWSYRARWNPRNCHPEVYCRVVRPVKAIRRTVKHLTNCEVLGVLNGQVQTAFHNAAVGFSSSRTTLTFPSDRYTLKRAWVGCWTTDSSLVDLVQQG